MEFSNTNLTAQNQKVSVTPQFIEGLQKLGITTSDVFIVSPEHGFNIAEKFGTGERVPNDSLTNFFTKMADLGLTKTSGSGILVPEAPETGSDNVTTNLQKDNVVNNAENANISDAIVPTLTPHETQQKPFVRYGDYFVGDNGIAHYMISGVLTKRPGCMERVFEGSVGTVQHRMTLRKIKNDERVKGLILTVESPGGEVSGTFDLAEEIKSFDQTKPVFTYAEDMALSGGFLLLAQGRKSFANSGAYVGSVGAYTELVSLAKVYEKNNLDVRVIKSGEDKAIGHPALLITDHAQEVVQERIIKTHDRFVRAIQGQRKYTKTNLKQIAKASVFDANDGVKLGMIDKVVSYENAIVLMEKYLKSQTSVQQKTGNKMDDETILGLEDLSETPKNEETPKVSAENSSQMISILEKNNITSPEALTSTLANMKSFETYVSNLRENTVKMAVALGDTENDYIADLPYGALVATARSLNVRHKATGNFVQKTGNGVEKVVEPATTEKTNEDGKIVVGKSFDANKFIGKN